MEYQPLVGNSEDQVSSISPSRPERDYHPVDLGVWFADRRVQDLYQDNLYILNYIHDIQSIDSTQHVTPADLIIIIIIIIHSSERHKKIRGKIAAYITTNLTTE